MTEWRGEGFFPHLLSFLLLLVVVVVVVVGTYFEYMAVKPLIVPSCRYIHLFQRVCNACNNNFPILFIKASKSYFKFGVIVQQILDLLNETSNNNGDYDNNDDNNNNNNKNHNNTSACTSTKTWSFR